jgi:hypothetical protein
MCRRLAVKLLFAFRENEIQNPEYFLGIGG